MGIAENIKTELEAVGVDPSLYDSIIVAIDAADGEVVDKTSKDPLAVIDDLPATISRVSGVPGMYLVTITLPDTSTLTTLRTQNDDGSWAVAPAGFAGPEGPEGPAGANGSNGATGATGPGVAAGGATGQYLRKASGTDYDTEWVSFPTTLSGYGITDAVSISGTQTVTGVKTFQPATDTTAVIVKTATGGATATKILVCQDASATEVFSVTGGGNVSFTNSATMRYAVITHTSSPDIYFSSSGYVTLRGAHNVGAGTATYVLDRLGTGTYTVNVAYFAEKTPSQITSNQNDYALTAGGTFFRISSDAARDITGIVPISLGGSNKGGMRITLANVGAFTITLKHQSGSSTAANRIIGVGAADVLLLAEATVDLVYDATAARWRVVS